MIETTEKNGILIAKFRNQDRFNALITEPVKETLLAFFTKPNVKLVMNLEGIRFIDSSGFSVFLAIMKTANNNYGEFKICNVDKEVIELFQVLQLHNVFEIHNTLDDCLQSFS